MMKFILTSAIILMTLNSSAQHKALLVTGTYTSGKSEGIYVFSINPETGDAEQVFVAKGIRNPSFLVVSPDRKYVYAVEELNGGGKAGNIVSYKFNDKDGSLTRINEVPSGGDDPCYITTDNSGKWVIVGNYSSGTVTVVPVSREGVLGTATSNITHEGSSVNKDRQTSPHVHATVLNDENNFLYVPDLGTDKVMIYGFNKKTGKLSPATTPFAATTPWNRPQAFYLFPSKEILPTW
jgi:6-phosphogluconolactonase